MTVAERLVARPNEHVFIKADEFWVRRYCCAAIDLPARALDPEPILEQAIKMVSTIVNCYRHRPHLFQSAPDPPDGLTEVAAQPRSKSSHRAATFRYRDRWMIRQFVR
jgi:hypothetical protein